MYVLLGDRHSMDVKSYRRYLALATTILAGIVAWSVIAQNMMVAVAGVSASMILLYLLRKRVKEVMIDERVHRISQMASRTTLQIFGWVSAASAFILIAFGRTISTGFEQAGYTLAYATCALLLMYSVFYKYYGSKFGD
jgi:uncharacterized membrane protein